MRKRIFILLTSAVLLLSMLAGCGAGQSKTAERPAAYSEVAKVEVKGNGDAKLDSKPSEARAEEPKKAEAQETLADQAEAEMDSTALTGTGSASQSVSNALLAQRKIIRNANVTIEVDDFDEAYGKINTFISGIGFVQETNIKREKVYTDNGEIKLITRGIIIIRVDKDRFDEVMNDIRGIGLLLDQQIKTDDVTEKFFDIESRLRLLRYEESRLEEYLKKLDDPDKIFKTEARLTDIRHEIEGLTGNLKKLSDLTELSTITINISERDPNSDNTRPPKSQPYGQRLLGNFKDSIKGVVSFCGELLILVVQALPVIMLLGLFAVLVLAVYRRIGKSRTVSKNKDIDS